MKPRFVEHGLLDLGINGQGRAKILLAITIDPKMLDGGFNMDLTRVGNC